MTCAGIQIDLCSHSVVIQVVNRGVIDAVIGVVISEVIGQVIEVVK